jgi:hypothetical protein
MPQGRLFQSSLPYASKRPAGSFVRGMKVCSLQVLSRKQRWSAAVTPSYGMRPWPDRVPLTCTEKSEDSA